MVHGVTGLERLHEVRKPISTDIIVTSTGQYQCGSWGRMWFVTNLRSDRK